MINEVDLSKDLISKSKLYDEAVRLSGPFTGDGWDNWGVYNLIMRQPTIEAEPVVEAHWIYSPCDGVWTTACSHCGYEETGAHMRKYKGCPMCRAKMTHIECVGHRKENECKINSANGF